MLVQNSNLLLKNMSLHGKFIVLDGCDGAGKTTLIEAAKKAYGNIIFTREPGGSPFAENIRSLMLKDVHSGQASPETQFCLAWAARHDHMKNVIIPAIAKGKHVLCDRFDSSTFAYQLYLQRGSNLKDLFWQMRKLLLEPDEPDHYIFLDVRTEVSLDRKGARKVVDANENNHFDDADMNGQERMRAGFNHFLYHVPHTKIDANGSREDVQQKFFEVLDQLLAAE